MSQQSQLVSLLARLKDSKADRVYFAPGEAGAAYNGETRLTLGGDALDSAAIVDAIAEVLSHDELGDLPSNRARIVRHEHAGENYVLEIVRQSSGIALGIRFAAPRPMRAPTFREGRDSIREPQPQAPAEPAPFPTASEEAPGDPLAEKPRSSGRRTRSSHKLSAVVARAPKRTVRVELDDEGNPVDSVAISIGLSLPRFAAVRPKTETHDQPSAPTPPEPPRLEPAPHRPIEPEPITSSSATSTSVTSSSITSASVTSAARILETMLALDPLADLPRTGWLLRGVRPCESVADHSFGVAFLAMLFVDAIRAGGGTIDGERTLRMALVHDAAEARTGDVPMPNKTPRVAEALHELEATLTRDLLPARQYELWAEVERGDSLEANVVAAADKAQLMIKALVYERQRRGDIGAFWDNAKNFDDKGIAVARELFEALAQAAGREVPKRSKTG